MFSFIHSFLLLLFSINKTHSPFPIPETAHNLTMVLPHPIPPSAHTPIDDLPPAYYTEAPPAYKRTDSLALPQVSHQESSSPPLTNESSHNPVTPPPYQGPTQLSNVVPQPLQSIHIHSQVVSSNSAPQPLQTRHIPPPIVASRPNGVYTELTTMHQLCVICKHVILWVIMLCVVVGVIAVCMLAPWGVFTRAPRPTLED
jgi:hypothetical protein